ncbi:MAG: cobalamin biosynthesis protein P47K, partial [Planctomycetota bacterium]
EYIFLKQLEEADVVVINKIDKLGDGEPERLAALVEDRLPGKEVLLASGKRGDGLDTLLDTLLQPRSAASALMPIDYEVYAAGEAELAWLNANVEFDAAAPFPLDDLVQECVQRVADNLSQASYEPAHLKVLGYSGGETCIANLVATGSPAELSLACGASSNAATLIVNARVAGDPEVLAAMVDDAIEEVGTRFGGELRVTARQHFRPGKPEPTHGRA